MGPAAQHNATSTASPLVPILWALGLSHRRYAALPCHLLFFFLRLTNYVFLLSFLRAFRALGGESLCPPQPRLRPATAYQLYRACPPAALRSEHPASTFPLIPLTPPSSAGLVFLVLLVPLVPLVPLFPPPSAGLVLLVPLVPLVPLFPPPSAGLAHQAPPEPHKPPGSPFFLNFTLPKPEHLC
jgi:hypothetical protein